MWTFRKKARKIRLFLIFCPHNIFITCYAYFVKIRKDDENMFSQNNQKTNCFSKEYLLYSNFLNTLD